MARGKGRKLVMSFEQALRHAAEEAIAYRSSDGGREPGEIASYAEMLETFSGAVPETPNDPDQVIGELVAKATPGLRPMTDPAFFGWVIGGSHPLGVAADWLTSAWGQNAGNHFATPAAAAAETVAGRWLVELLDLPREASVGFVTGASMANFVGLAAARGELLRRAGWDVEADGLIGAPKLNVLIGADAHETVFMALRYLGLGAKRAMRIETDELGRMRIDALRGALQSLDGPGIVITQAGQLNTGAFDPFGEICALAHDHGCWVHVDGAFGLWARASKRYRHFADGVEQADSWAVDGHKWLQTPYDSGFAIVANRDAHARAMQMQASYLPSGSEEEREPSAYVPELSRRARGFATWAMIRHLGRSGIAEMIDANCDFAAALAQSLDGAAGVEIVSRPLINQLLLRFGDSDQATLDTVQEIQRRGRMFAGPALWREQWVMRISATNYGTEPSQAREIAREIIEAWTATQDAAQQEPPSGQLSPA
jgi:glutamate/tyrosine decarboxylase-like PLP-dependent enzyme